MEYNKKNITSKSYFTQIPNSFIRNTHITTNEKIMYIYLYGFGVQSKNMYPGQSRIIKELGWSKSKVISVLNRLEKSGRIYIINRCYEITNERATNLYYLSDIDNSTDGFITDSLNVVKAIYPNKIKYI